jgi:hypothetical protein
MTAHFAHCEAEQERPRFLSRAQKIRAKLVSRRAIEHALLDEPVGVRAAKCFQVARRGSLS